MHRPSRVLTLALIAAFFVAWIFALRWSTFDRPTWNLDEGIHAAVAREILHGGTMYRDAIDQRTPFTYYLAAGLFALVGHQNMWALHALLAGIVSATAFLLLRISWRWHGAIAGAIAAAMFAALSTNLLYPGDAYSFSTEWCVALFTSLGTWWFWSGEGRIGFRRAAATGVAFALAFLSKQPALLDAGAPLLTLAWLGITARSSWRDRMLPIAGFGLGWLLPVLLTCLYFFAHDAFADFRFYAWDYNLHHYGTVATRLDQLTVAWSLPLKVLHHYPVPALLMGGGLLYGVALLLQWRPTEADRAEKPRWLYLLAWTALAWAAASASGRSFDHYAIQVLPPLALLVGSIGGVVLRPGQASPSLWLRAMTAVVALALGWSVLRGPWRPRPDTPPAEYYHGPAAAFVAKHTRPDDRIFVWGFQPDFYLLADRRSASRYLYCSFQTGSVFHTRSESDPPLIPTGRTVPGAVEQLIADLKRNLPEFIVDTSLNRRGMFGNDPLAKYPVLWDFVRTHYVEVVADEMAKAGCTGYLLKDEVRPSKREPKAGTSAQPGGLQTPHLTGPAIVDPMDTDFLISASHSSGALQRLELLTESGRVLAAATVAPTEGLALRVTVPFGELGLGKHRLQARATGEAGEVRTSPVLVVECTDRRLSPERAQAFGLWAATTPVAATALVAPYGATVSLEKGRRVYFAHAPSTLTYPVGAQAASLRGRFGFRDGAWNPENPDATDGAEFVIELKRSDGARVLLLKRLLRPASEASDRGEHAFDVFIPAGSTGEVVFTITPGPHDNASHDWTYWSDLLLVTVE